MKETTVTVWVDASVKEGQAGYGVIAEASNGGSLSYIGSYACNDINVAESYAIATAVDFSMHAWPDCWSIDVITDSQVVANIFNNTFSGVASPAVERNLDRAVNEMCERPLTINWQPRCSSERLRQVDTMARAAVRSSK